jgi:hypothetical protein
MPVATDTRYYLELPVKIGSELSEGKRDAPIMFLVADID